MASTFLGGGGGDASVVGTGGGGGGGGDASAANQTLQLTELQGINSKIPGVRTPTTTSVANTGASVQVLAALSTGKAVLIVNDSTTVARLSFSTPATTANAFAVLQPGGYAYIPLEDGADKAISSISASATGNLQVTRWV